jgi:hypothetical protein
VIASGTALRGGPPVPLERGQSASRRESGGQSASRREGPRRAEPSRRFLGVSIRLTPRGREGHYDTFAQLVEVVFQSASRREGGRDL